MSANLNENGSLAPHSGHEINLSQVESISTLTQFIWERSIPYQCSPVPTSPDDLQDSNPGDGGEDFRLLSICEMTQIGASHISASGITLGDLFKPDYRTMIYGDSNVGKSYFMLQIALAYAAGTSCFCFAKTVPMKVAYIDGELGDSFLDRLYMLNSGNPINLDNTLKVMRLRGSTLEDSKAQGNFLSRLQGFNPSLVIIDNIIALMNSAVKGNVKGLISVVKEIEKMHAAVVLVHHTCKNDDTYKGPSELAALSQNVIHLRGRTQIEEEFAKEGCPIPPRMAALIASKDIGPVISVSFEKCKICPEFEKVKNFYYLPINGQWMPLDINGTPIPGPGVKAHDSTDNLCKTDSHISEVLPSRTARSASPSQEEDKVATAIVLGDLTDDQRRILEEAKKTKMTNARVRTLLGCSESKASGLLKSLVESNLLRKIGAGRSTGYVPVNA